MSVKYVRKEVRNRLKVWAKIRKVMSGPKAVKDAGTDLLPMPNPDDKSEENKARYESYKLRAVFYSVTRRTHDGLVGQIFYRDTVFELPPLLKPLEMSVDGGENTLEQQSKNAVSECLSIGHGGFLTDYPKTEQVTTRAQQLEGSIRPNILLYQAEQIINWRIESRGTRRFLAMLVLKETYEYTDDGIEPESAVQWRVMDLDEGILRVRIYRENKGAEVLVDDSYPKMGNGKPWREIPFSFFGAINNDAQPDDSPMEDLVELNIGHYRNSADYEEACFIVGQPTPWASGLTEDWVKEVWKDKSIMLGSRAFLPLPANAAAGLLQVSPNSMPKEAMEHKERQMVALGAKLVEQQAVQRTATEAGLESLTENSVLSTIAKNVSAAYMKALGHAMMYSNATGNLAFELNTDFEINKLTPQERQQLLAEWQGNAITWEEYRWNIKKAGIAYEDDDKAKAKIDAEADDDLDLDGGISNDPGRENQED